MMNKYTISGCGTALVTPFRDDQIDFPAYAKLVRRQANANIDFLVALGSTAETPCLENSEKEKILETTIENAPNKTIVAGVGTNCLRNTLENMRLLQRADMFLVVVPYYNHPTQDGLFRYFSAVAAATDKPIILYNVPSRTGVNMTDETTLRLAEIPNIVAIKEASANLQQIGRIIDGAPEGFAVLSGNDHQTLDTMKLGGQGLISVASNIAPAEMRQLVAFAANKEYEEAEKLSRKLMPLMHGCFVESNPIPVKAGLAAMGLICNELRSPLYPCTQETWNLMKSIIEPYCYE